MASLAPFRLLGDGDTFGTRIGWALQFTAASFRWNEVLERAVAFAPLGLLLGYRTPRISRSLVLIGGLAVGLEVGQLLIRGRHARMCDVVVAVAVGAISVFAGRRARGVIGVARLSRWLLITGQALACLLPGLAQWGTRLADWHPDFPLVIGNELSGDRPWLGRLRGVAFYDRAHDADGLALLRQLPMDADGFAVRRGMGLVCGYDFAARRGWQRGDAGWGAWDLAVSVADPPAWSTSPEGLELSGPSLIRTQGPADVLNRQLPAHDALTVEVRAAAQAVDQRGPARLVSLSISTGQRNLTLGQDGAAVELRVRTPRMGLNGSRSCYVSAAGTLDTGWHDLAATVDRGTLQLWVDAAPAAPPLRLTEVGALLVGRALPVPLGGVVAAVLVVLPLAIMVRLVLVSPMWLTSVIAAGPTSAVALVAARLSEHPADRSYIIAAVAVALVGAGWGRSRAIPDATDIPQ